MSVTLPWAKLLSVQNQSSYYRERSKTELLLFVCLPKDGNIQSPICSFVSMTRYSLVALLPRTSSGSEFAM